MKKPKTVWVVEDNEVYSRALTLQLRAFGVNVLLVDNVKKASPNEGDIVLLDLMGTDSAEASFGKGVKVFSMSACADFLPNYVKPLTQRTISHILNDSDETPPKAATSTVVERSIELLKKIAG